MNQSGPLLWLQKAARLNTLGRLRMGTSTPGQNGGKKPQKSSTWVISSPNREYIELAASLYGGTCEVWQKTAKEREYRVVTKTDTLPVYVLPFAPQQALERFNDRRRIVDLRCDGTTCRQRSASGNWEESPCACDPQNNPKPACGAKLTTRVSFILPQMPAIGTWMLETHGYYAAVEIPAGLEFVRVQDRLVARALLRLEPRRRVDPAGGPDRMFYVPVLHLENTPHHLEALTTGDAPVALLGRQAKALTTGRDPLEDMDDDHGEFVEPAPDPDLPEAGYTEQEFARLCAALDVRSDLARQLLAMVRPPSLDALERQLVRMASAPGVRLDTRLVQLAKQAVPLRSWDEFVACVDEAAGDGL